MNTYEFYEIHDKKLTEKSGPFYVRRETMRLAVDQFALSFPSSLGLLTKYRTDEKECYFKLYLENTDWVSQEIFFRAKKI